jgi:hypothetical protein
MSIDRLTRSCAEPEGPGDLQDSLRSRVAWHDASTGIIQW